MRAQAARAKTLRNAAGLLLAVLLLVGLAMTPVLQLRMRSQEGLQSFNAMVAKTKDVAAQREQLMQNADQVGTLADLLAERIDPVRVLGMLTTELADDTALQTARIQNGKVNITGLTGDASALMQKLGNLDGIKDVKAPSAATRMQGATRETFSIELTLDPKVYGVLLKPAESDSEPMASVTPAATPQSTAAAAVPTPAPAAPVSAPASATSVSAPTASIAAPAASTVTPVTATAAPAAPSGPPIGSVASPNYAAAAAAKSSAAPATPNTAAPQGKHQP